MRDKHLTLGSLFDGSGGFPLAGILSGIEPVWASEVEPFAIRVTTKRLPSDSFSNTVTANTRQSLCLSRSMRYSSTTCTVSGL